MNGLFVTGTDTGVGKTFVCCEIARAMRAAGLRVGIYKPACSGALESSPADAPRWSDIERLADSIEHQFSREWICPQRFLAPLAPPEAARVEGRAIDTSLLRSGASRWKDQVDYLLVEGAGGWLSPLAEFETVADLACDLNWPVLIVAANRLGMINQTLLTVESIRSRGLPISGIVVNHPDDQEDDSQSSNVELLRRFTNRLVLGPLPWCSEGVPEGEFLKDIDWPRFFGDN